jgi:acetoin utilization deacetylase AcuC-like enzyme
MTAAQHSCFVAEESLHRFTKFSLHEAVERGDAGAVSAILAPPRAEGVEGADAMFPPMPLADVNGRDNTGCTPLHTALLFRQLDTMRLCLLHGAKLGLKCNGSPLLHIVLALAALPGNANFCLAAAQALLEAGVDAASVDDLGRAPLHVAALHGCVDLAGVIWAHAPARERSDLAFADRTGATPLHTAAEARQKGMLQWLCSVGAPLGAVDKLGDTPAHAAAKAGWLAGVEALRAAGASAESLSGAGYAPAQVLAASAWPAGRPPAPEVCTLIITHEACAHHYTCAAPLTRDSPAVPPENTARLDVLLNPGYGTLRAADVTGSASRARIVDCAPPVKLSDVLRVHEYEYVRRLLHAAGAAGSAGFPHPPGVYLLDSDTAVSRGSWQAALRAAGAVCAAIDSVMAGACRTAFCPVRPPGHHAGPRGVVTNENDPDGSHGFCLLNNVAIGAAYAMAMYGRQAGGYAAEAGLLPARAAAAPLRRVAIFDFDVHHGNGTEAILRALTPHEVMSTVVLPFARAAIGMAVYRPWLDAGDGSNVMFISTHGYGSKHEEDGTPVPASVFYPGSGRSSGWDAAGVERAGAARGLGGEPGTPHPSASSETRSALSAPFLPAEQSLSSLATPRAASVVPSLDGGPPPVPCDASPLPPAQHSLQPMPIPEPMLEAGVAQPRLINVAMPRSAGPKAWRRAMTADVLPRLAAFAPDLILVSAGFDAHKADTINSGYIRLAEEDYTWITRQLVKIGNTTASGRVVSVLEGGYRVQGRVVSPFARSVAAHVRALSAGLTEVWDTEGERATLGREMAYEAEQVVKAVAAAEAAAAAARAAAGEGAGLGGFRSPRSTFSRAGGSTTPAAALGSDAGSGAGSSSLQSALVGGGAEMPAEGGGLDSGRGKRRRVAVDYAALDLQLRAAGSSATPAGAACEKEPRVFD